MGNEQTTGELRERKNASRAFLRSLPLEEKIARLVDLQERYYKMLVLRASNGGRPIPEKWKKWREARRSQSAI